MASPQQQRDYLRQRAYDRAKAREFNANFDCVLRIVVFIGVVILYFS